MQKQKTLFYFLCLIFTIQSISFPSAAQTQPESLYKRLGEVNIIAAIIDDFTDKFLAEPVIIKNTSVSEAMKKTTKPGLKFLISEMLCEITGGPQKYTGKSMKEAHQGMNITEDEWQAMKRDFIASLLKFNVLDQEKNELLAILEGLKKDIVATEGSKAQPAAAPSPAPAQQAPQPQATEEEMPPLPPPPSKVMERTIQDTSPKVPAQPLLPEFPSIQDIPPLPEPLVRPSPPAKQENTDDSKNQ